MTVGGEQGSVIVEYSLVFSHCCFRLFHAYGFVLLVHQQQAKFAQ